MEAWSGIVLLAEASPKSIEPNYKEHRKVEWLNFLKRALLFASCGLPLLVIYITRSLYANLGLSLLLFINLIGVFIGWLLLLKQLRIQSQYVDKICSLFKQSACNNALESKAAKLFGIIGWAEVGLGYFLTNVLLILFAPALIPYIALINIVTLPFSFWSVWYQKTKAKQWCALCLTVQVLLWAIFVVNCLFGYIQIPEIGIPSLLTLTMIGSGYVASILGIHLLAPESNTKQTMQHLRQSLNSLKADEEVFIALLKKQPHYDTNDCQSIIRFGNQDAPIQFTVLTNPYCNPCSKMHTRIEELLQKTNNQIGVQYILSSFKEELNATNKYLIAACLADDSGSAKQIFSDWFTNGKAQKEAYYKDWGLDITDPKVEEEFQKHEIWRKKTLIRATPTILVNGYQLPEGYKVEDLENFIKFNLDIK